LLGQALTVWCAKAVDVVDLWKDRRFIRSWWPMRRRTEQARKTAAGVLETWERLGSEVPTG
jgi:hypothetical protein